MTLEVTSASCQDWSSVLTHLCDVTPSGGGAGSLGVPHHLTLIIPAGHLDPRLGVERVVPLHGVQIHWRMQDLKKGGVVVEGDHEKGRVWGRKNYEFSTSSLLFHLLMPHFAYYVIGGKGGLQPPQPPPSTSEIGTQWSRVCGHAFHSILGQVCIHVRGQPLGVGQPSLLGGRWPNFALSLSCCYTCVLPGQV